MSAFIRQLETLVWQRTKPFINQSQLPPDVLPIKFKLYKSIIRAWCPQEDDDVTPIVMSCSPRNLILVTQETIVIHRAMLQSNSTRALMVDILSGMLVPEREQPAIIGKIFHLLVEKYSSDNTNTMLPIVVGINYVTLQLRPNTSTNTIVGDQTSQLIARAASESMQTYEAKPVPADKSCVENLERVRFDYLEEGTRKLQACAICMEEFENGVEVIQLPCSHIYHGDCIVQWLEMCQLCPLCRYPMPPA